MADNDKKNGGAVDLDAILSEINSNMKKEVLKSNNSVADDKKSSKPESKPEKKKAHVQKPKGGKKDDLLMQAFNSSFVESAKIIEDALSDLDDQSDDDIIEALLKENKPKQSNELTDSERIIEDILKSEKRAAAKSKADTKAAEKAAPSETAVKPAKSDAIEQKKAEPVAAAKTQHADGDAAVASKPAEKRHEITVISVESDEQQSGPQATSAKKSADMDIKRIIEEQSQTRLKDAVITNEPPVVEYNPQIREGQTSRFIAVTASEVVEAPIKAKPASDGEILLKPAMDEAEFSKETDPEISRENNRHIKKIRQKQKRTKITKRKRRSAILGAVVAAFVIVGFCVTAWSAVQFGIDVVNRTDQKEQLAREVFPLVIIDTPEFDNPTKLDSAAIISSAIWEFVLSEDDKSKYASDDLGAIYVPDVDIEYYIRSLFGNDVKIKHQSVEDASIMMIYDAESKTYCIESTPRFLPYTPKVQKVARTGDIYTLTVGYILPDVMWNLGVDESRQQVDKTMEFVLKKTKNNYQALSVKLISVTGASQAVSSDKEALPAMILDYGVQDDEPDADEIVSSEIGEVLKNSSAAEAESSTEESSSEETASIDIE